MSARAPAARVAFWRKGDKNFWCRAEALQEYADAAWDRLRDQSTGLFHFDRSRSAKLLEQAAMVQIYAALAAPKGR